MTTIVYVCTTCASTWENGKRVGISGGEMLLRALTDSNSDQELVIRPVNCMSACSQSCAVAFMSPGKYSYLFGNLQTESVAAILECAAIYHRKPDGMMAWQERPVPLRSNLLAKLPPL
ncbi:MAG: DUF1636 domain-containing protein [Pseudanabaenaceae cyanobacterium SKYGB_i_bin29]|nr:DUF1636 domain-containing protein [Pseudanabaenaceae cyanobacterium SKYG29]MDW8420924.1 DUF1636 domain-containing protein [Pseudanabaenaceae cyanobacterium SKYGB_i_bin29]